MKHKLLFLIYAFSMVFITSCKDDAPTPPVASANPASQIINSGSATAIALTSNVTGTISSWTVVQSGVTGASAGSGTSIAQTLTLTGSEAGTATYTIVPTANGVVGNPVVVVITVNVVKTTYAKDIKPLLTTSCTPCHLAGGTNPNKWDDYASAKGKITTIIDRVKREPGATGFMPRNGAKLSAAQIALLEKWLKDGTPEN
jgi:hypothetical protein